MATGRAALVRMTDLSTHPSRIPAERNPSPLGGQHGKPNSCMEVVFGRHGYHGTMSPTASTAFRKSKLLRPKASRVGNNIYFECDIPSQQMFKLRRMRAGEWEDLI